MDNRNRFPPCGMSTSLGGFPFCQGTSPCFLNQSPMAELRNSGHVVQNPRVSFTATGIPSTSTTTTSHFLLKNFFTFARPTFTPSATPLRALNFPFFHAATSKPNLQGGTVRPAPNFRYSFALSNVSTRISVFTPWPTDNVRSTASVCNLPPHLRSTWYEVANMVSRRAFYTWRQFETTKSRALTSETIMDHLTNLQWCDSMCAVNMSTSTNLPLQGARRPLPGRVGPLGGTWRGKMAVRPCEGPSRGCLVGHPSPILAVLP